MPQPGEALGQLFDQVLQARGDSLQRKLAAEQSELISNVNIEAFTKLDNDFDKMAPGTFNADDQAKWFDEMQSQKLNGITDERAKSALRARFANIRARFVLNAHDREIRSNHKAEKLAVDNSNSQYLLDIQNAAANGDINSITQQQIQFSEAVQMGSELTSNQGKTYAQEKAIESLRLTETVKLNTLKSQLASLDIDEAEFETALQQSERNISRIGIIDPQTRVSMISDIQKEAIKAKEEALKSQLSTLHINFDGEVQKYLLTGKENPRFVSQLVKFSQNDPELASMALYYQHVKEAVPFYNAKRTGNAQVMSDELGRLATRLTQLDVDGSTYQKELNLYNQLERDYSHFIKEFRANPANVLSRDPQLQFQKAHGLSRGDMTNYVNSIISKGRSLDIKPESMTFLSDSEVNVYVKQLSNPQLTTDQVKMLGANIKALYNQPINASGRTAADNVFDQIIRKSDSTAALALSYLDTPEFSEIQGALQLGSKGVDYNSILPTGVTSDKLKKAINKKIDQHIENFVGIGTSPGEAANIKRRYRDLAYKVGVSFLQTHDENDTGAAAFVEKVLFTNHFETVGGKPTWDAFHGRASNEVQLMVQKDKPEWIRIARDLKSTPGSARTLVMQFLKKTGGDAILRGDVSNMIDSTSVPGRVLISKDFDSMIEDARIVDNPGRDGVMVQIKVNNNGNPKYIPLVFKSGLAEFTYDELVRTNLIKPALRSGDVFQESLRQPITRGGF